MERLSENTTRLDEKRLLSVRDFERYASIGHNNAYKLINRSGCGIRIGNKILVDRIRFDDWCSSQIS